MFRFLKKIKFAQKEKVIKDFMTLEKQSNDETKKQMQLEEKKMKEEEIHFLKIANENFPFEIKYDCHWKENLILAKAIGDGGEFSLELKITDSDLLIKENIQKIKNDYTTIKEKIQSLHPDSEVSFYRFYQSFAHEFVFDFFVDKKMITIKYHKNFSSAKDSLLLYESSIVTELQGVILKENESWLIDDLSIAAFLKSHRGQKVKVSLLEEKTTS